MEEYIFENMSNEKVEIHFGRFFELVHKKHIISYTEEGANNIVENIVETYKRIQLQLMDQNMNNNSLLVGKVQSGKTSNLELFTALAFDNGYNVLVIYGGYDKSLLGQTTERFKETFDAIGEISYDKDCPAIFTTAQSTDIENLDDSIIEDLLENGKPLIFVSMKRPNAMSKINKLFRKLDTSKLKAFIIDDEGDQASLNTAKDKIKNASATYREIRNMKALLSDPMYLSVTATPHANIFLDEWSELRPDSIRLIQPGFGYQGADIYHLDENEIVEIVSDGDKDDILEGAMPASLWDSIRYFIVASAIKELIAEKNSEKYSDMIIHAFREVSQHSSIYNAVDSFIRELQIVFEYDESIESYIAEFEACYNEFVPEEIKSCYTFEVVKAQIPIVIKKTRVILKNSIGQATTGNDALKWHKIYIGGDLLQRGLTFKNLVTTYFIRWANSGGTMDANLQRARWFGYRKRYIAYCKLFTTSNIAQEFTNLAEIEDDLWEQFAEVEDGRLKVSDVVIRSEGTKQAPTGKGRVNYKKVSFKNRWIKQRYIVFDRAQNEKNKTAIEKMIKNNVWKETTVGSTNNSITGKYCYLSADELKQLINLIQEVFDNEPFQRKALLDLLDQNNIPVILMWDTDKNKCRYRSMYKEQNKIKALQQGADSADRSKMTYEGDSSVIIDRDKINIQIHFVSPGYRRGEAIAGLEQYMFAVYLPKEKVYFVRGD